LPTDPLRGWDRGVDAFYLRELMRYWAEGFDWRAQERRMNVWPHYRVEAPARALPRAAKERPVAIEPRMRSPVAAMGRTRSR
jgi:hypothetical protein